MELAFYSGKHVLRNTNVTYRVWWWEALESKMKPEEEALEVIHNLR